MCHTKHQEQGMAGKLFVTGIQNFKQRHLTTVKALLKC